MLTPTHIHIDFVCRYLYHSSLCCTYFEKMATPNDADNLFEAFEKLGFIPKHETDDDLIESMKDFISSKGIKVEPELEQPHHNPPPQPQPQPQLAPQPQPHPTRPLPQQNIIIHQVIPPKISFFSGETSNKVDVTYEQWMYEVQCLLDDTSHSPETIYQTIRRSLRGEAGHIAVRLGPDATMHELIRKMEMVYGTQESGTTILSQFYSAKQEEHEDVSQWGFRLEGLLHKAVQLGEVLRSKTDSLLRKVFWNGLKPYLKDVSGHKYDSIGEFDALRVAIKRIENAKKNELTAIHIHSATTSSSDSSEISKLKGMIKQLTNRFDKLEASKKTDPDSGSGNLSSQDSSPSGDISQLFQEPTSHQEFSNSSHYGNRNIYSDRYYPTGPTFNTGYQPTSDRQQASAPVCYRCGQIGHIQIGCRVILDHSRSTFGRRRGNLNAYRPMRRGHP